ncbi:putative G-protein coupled receptor 133 [Stylophora pistillata]|uniref:Putative G-protein coupled receptor 133 n=1 Tax=Stylophora pistillata TaxID=50429 RepID=A0A2B4RBQ6_STYPI|nr:putative G-protein coupled receptor 133 [Stylophora pistillata]
MRPIRPADGGEDPIFVTLAFEEFMTRIAKSRLNSTNPEVNYTGKDMAFRVRRIVRKEGSDFLFNDSDGENSIKIPSANLHPNGSIVLGMAYKSLHQLFPGYVTDPDGTNKKSNSSWSREGCQTRVTSHSRTECVCNHLTHFAVLMDFTDKDDDEKDLHDKALTLLTRVGMAVSLTGIFLTTISYLQLTDRLSPLCHIRVSLASCIGAGHIIFLAGIDATGNKGACVSVAALEQYFVMAAFCWMLVDGIYIYLFVVKVYNITDDIRRYHGCCWGAPAIIVALSLGIAAGKDGVETFVRDKNCWMSATNNIIWIFVSFVGLIVIINIAILVRVIKEMTTIQHVQENQAEQIRLGVHASVVLAPLLGFTWLIGFLLPLHVAFFYIFVILNSTQGFSIFFFHCLRNSEIKERFKRRFWCIKADNRITPQANQSRNNAEIPEASSKQRF